MDILGGLQGKAMLSSDCGRSQPPHREAKGGFDLHHYIRAEEYIGADLLRISIR
jgi:hypothetical protein